MKDSKSVLAGVLPQILTFFDFWQSNMVMRLRNLFVFGSLARGIAAQCSQRNGSIDLGWHAPNKTHVNDLNFVINGTGANGFIYNTSVTPVTAGYGTYNWCNMPHVRRQEYVKAPEGYKLEYVELVGGRIVAF